MKYIYFSVFIFATANSDHLSLALAETKSYSFLIYPEAERRISCWDIIQNILLYCFALFFISEQFTHNFNECLLQLLSLVGGWLPPLNYKYYAYVFLLLVGFFIKLTLSYVFYSLDSQQLYHVIVIDQLISIGLEEFDYHLLWHIVSLSYAFKNTRNGKFFFKKIDSRQWVHKFFFHFQQAYYGNYIKGSIY